MSIVEKSFYICGVTIKHICTMSTATLKGLLEYLYGTLSISNMRWMGEHLIEYAKQKEDSERLKPFTMEEIDNMLDEAEAAFEAGDYLTHDEVFRRSERRVAV